MNVPIAADARLDFVIPAGKWVTINGICEVTVQDQNRQKKFKVSASPINVGFYEEDVFISIFAIEETTWEIASGEGVILDAAGNIAFTAEQSDSIGKQFVVDAITAVDATSLGLVDGDVVVARGRSAVGDGGDGTFRYSAASTQTVDSGTVFQPTAGTGRLFREGWTVLGFNGPLSFLWFGAAGDWNGSTGTDDSDAIDACIASIEGFGGGEIACEPGRGFGISRTVVLGNGGAGVASTYSIRLKGAGSSPLASDKALTTFAWVGTSGDTGAMMKIAGQISGVEVSGIYLDGQNKIFDGLQIRSSFGGVYTNILIQKFRRRGLDIGADITGSSTWYSSNNYFRQVLVFASYVNRSGGDTYAFYLRGNLVQDIGGGVAGAFRNVFEGCAATVYSDSTSATSPAALYLGYCDSNTWIECDLNRSGSALDANQDIVAGTVPSYAGTGHSVIFDSTERTAFPLNNTFHNCSLVGGYETIEPGANVVGTNHFINQTSRDWESAPVPANRIRGFNDRGWYFGGDDDVPISLRGDDTTLRLMAQDRTRRWDIALDQVSGAGALRIKRTTDALGTPVTTTWASGLSTGVFEFPAGVRSFTSTITDDGVAVIATTRTEGTMSLSRNGACTQNMIVAYDAVGTATVALMASGGSVNVAVTTGVLTGTTGTDGKLTVSPANDGNIYIENRTGGSITVVGTFIS